MHENLPETLIQIPESSVRHVARMLGPKSQSAVAVMALDQLRTQGQDPRVCRPAEPGRHEFVVGDIRSLRSQWPDLI